MIIGDKQRFAFEVGPMELGTSLRQVDIFVGGCNVCRYDNAVYVPQVIASVEGAIEQISALAAFSRSWDDAEEAHRLLWAAMGDADDEAMYECGRQLCFLQLGPTTDNVCAFLIPTPAGWLLSYEFWREASGVRSVGVDLAVVREACEGLVSALKR